MPRPLQALSGDNRPDVGEAGIHVLVDQHIIVLGPMADLARRPLHAIGDHLLRIGVASAQAPLELGHRRRQDENPHQILTHRRVELLGPLPVDVEQDIAASSQCILHRRLRGTVKIAEHRCPFDELARGDQSVELGPVDEMIIGAFGFAGALRARRGDTDIVISRSASSSMREMVVLPAPDGEERTIRSPRRWRVG